MTVSSTNRKAGPYSCNGSQTVFSFSFRVLQPSDVLVIRTDLSGAETELALTSDYTVALNPDQESSPGGTVTLLSAPASGWLITLTSDVQNLQPVSLTNLGGFYPDVINAALDRVTIQIQQLGEKVGRSLKMPISSTEAPDPDALIAIATSAASAAAASASVAEASAESASDSASTVVALATTYATSGSAPGFTVAPSPSIPSYVSGLRLRVRFHAVGSAGGNTLNVSGLGPVSLKQYNSSGAKVNAVIAASMLTDIEHDGADFVVLEPVGGDNLNSSGSMTVNASALLTTSDVGKTIICNYSATAYTVTLPSPGSVPAGGRIHVFNANYGAGTTLAAASGALKNANGIAATSKDIEYRHTAVFESDGVSFWYLVDGTFAMRWNWHLEDSTASIKMGDGLRIQYGSWTSSSTAGAAVAVSFPTAGWFSAVYGIAVIAENAATTSTPVWYDTLTTDGFNGRCGVASKVCRYIAFGR